MVLGVGILLYSGEIDLYEDDCGVYDIEEIEGCKDNLYIELNESRNNVKKELGEFRLLKNGRSCFIGKFKCKHFKYTRFFKNKKRKGN